MGSEFGLSHTSLASCMLIGSWFLGRTGLAFLMLTASETAGPVSGWGIKLARAGFAAGSGSESSFVDRSEVSAVDLPYGVVDTSTGRASNCPIE
jgi:hypothetical protein